MNQVVAITGNTYPVKDQLRAMGARWNQDQKAWMVRADQEELARRIVSGGVTTHAQAAPPAPGMATDRQRETLRKLLRRVENIERFDSFSGSGAQVADDIRTEIESLGGTKALRSRDASRMISTLIGCADDEM